MVWDTLELFNTPQKLEKLRIAQPFLKVALLVEIPLHWPQDIVNTIMETFMAASQWKLTSSIMYSSSHTSITAYYTYDKARSMYLIVKSVLFDPKLLLGDI